MVTQYIKYYDIKIVLFTIILENYDSKHGLINNSFKILLPSALFDKTKITLLVTIKDNFDKY
jgi:hypothetical protein